MPWSGTPLSQTDEAMAQEIADYAATIALDGWREVVVRVPVDTGRARASTHLSVGSADTTTMPEVRNAKGKRVYGEPSTPSVDYVLWPTFYITNAVPYIGRLEEGYSEQAPNGMFKLAMAYIEAAYP